MDKRPDLLHRCELLENLKVARDWYRLKLKAPALCGAEPGQFVHLRPDSGTDPLLRRPLSIHYTDPAAGEIWLLLRVAGRVTARLSELRAGALLDLLGPLGSGFPCTAEREAALLLAGGIGMAPLYFLARRRRAAALPCELLIGGTDASSLPADPYFKPDQLAPLLATEDGSRGMKGTATELLEQRLRDGPPPARIHACGPLPMLAAAVELAGSYGVPVHVSLETRLACAVGACLGCAFPFKGAGGIVYRRVCKDGPVFNGEEACFEQV